MSYLPRPGISLASARRQVDALKRKLALVLAQYRLKQVADHIVELWNIAVAKKKPRPDAVDCVRIVADAGFRPKSWNVLHGYIDHCWCYGLLPDVAGIIGKLLPPGKKATPAAALSILSR